MTLDDAIKQYAETAKELREQPFKENMDIEDVAACEECAEEQEQLVSWLLELKSLKENKGDLISRNDLKSAIKYHCEYLHENSMDLEDILDMIDYATAVVIVIPETDRSNYLGGKNQE